jgi:glucosamine--fructose-6-phosphate aminotransferase (isomerizing)
MCGIVGYVGSRDAVPVILDGLRHLEYRGYDSAGLAILSGKRVERRRSEGKLQRLEDRVQGEPLQGTLGIGHTRWATHGRPSEENAHPHQDCQGDLVVVHNGIIENYVPLKVALQEQGHVFLTQTDTEVVAHLVESQYRGSLLEAVQRSLPRLKGIYALLFLHRLEPETLVAARMGPPMVLGVGEGEQFVASDVPALLAHTRDFVFLDDGEVASVSPKGFRVFAGEAPVTKVPQRITWDPVQAEKGGYRHYMLKEIHEQPRAVRDTLQGRLGLEDGVVHLQELGAAGAGLLSVDRAVLLACGTSWHAALVGKFFLEQIAKIPCEVDYGSEFRYREPLVSPQTLALAISQSGETADTLGAFREAKAKGALPLAITNVQGSMLTREAKGTLLTHAGPEIGVASTKAFTAQLAALFLVALHLGLARKRLGTSQCQALLEGLARVPQLMEQVLSGEGRIEELARTLAEDRDFLYIGRGLNYPIALEGALKLKEISYLHAEGYPAGEMKHGPIALIDAHLPVVALCPRGRVHEKMLSNIQEVKARDGRVIALYTEGDEATRVLLDPSRDVGIPLPETDEIFSPFLTILPLQLLAYHIAARAGRDVDQPRNLAKSVTVE